MADEHDRADRDLVHRHRHGRGARWFDQRGARDPIGQQAQALTGAPNAVVLERLAAREHQRNDGTDLELICCDGRGDRQ